MINSALIINCDMTELIVSPRN